MSKEISKDYLEEIIERKANEKIDRMLENLCGAFPQEINGNGNLGIQFNDKCGELSGTSLSSFNHSFGLLNNMGNENELNKFTNWPEIREKLFERYKEEETDCILRQLNGINNFINTYSEL